MNPSVSRAVHRLITQSETVLMDDWQARVRDDELGAPEEQRQEMAALLRALSAWLQAADPAAAEARRRALDTVLADSSQLRVARGQTPESAVRFVQALKHALLARVDAELVFGSPEHREAQTLVHGELDRCVTAQVTQFVAARESVIRSQAQSLLDMSTPVISLWDAILLLPLVGIVDSVRAVQIAERLLEAIGRTEAEVTLIDVTGVPVMDTSVARHLLRTIAAAEMLGTRVIVTGISPDTAQTIVKLGIDMSRVPTRGTLKAGVALALQFTGRHLSARGGA